MKTEIFDLMKMARQSLKGKWALAIGATFIYFLLPTAIQRVPIPIPFGGLILSLLIGGPLSLGLAIFVLSISRNQEAKIQQLFEGFKHWATSLFAYVLIFLIVILSLLLFIVPGIIAHIKYSMTFYIIADDKSISAIQAMRRSKRIMNGHKWEYFFMVFGFYFLAILCIFLIGKGVLIYFVDGFTKGAIVILAIGGLAVLGFLFSFPYIKVSCAKFYEDIKDAELITDKV